MNEENYTKRELDSKFAEVHERFNRQDSTLEKIFGQTTKTNGRTTELEQKMNKTASKDELGKIKTILLIVGCVTGTLLVTNGSELVKFIMSII